MRIKALEPIEYIVSFIAPYSLLVEPQIAMSMYFGRITIS